MIRLVLVIAIVWPVLVCGQQAGAERLPLLLLDTGGQRIPDEPKVAGRLTIVPAAERGGADGMDVTKHVQTVVVGVEQRGSSSKRFPKKGYGLETRTSEGRDLDVSLLGLSREEDWVLHGPYSDKSLVRNALAYSLASDLSVWTPGVRLVELKVNGDYRGVYLLTEKIKQDANRIDLPQPGEEGDALTGGYVLKIDKMTGSEGGGFRSRQRLRSARNPPVTFQFHAPGPDEVSPAQRAYVEDWMHRFEQRLVGEDNEGEENGYEQLIDDGSFIDFFLVNELSRNVDGFRISTYFYKAPDRQGGQLYMGPVWDFNIAFGNADYCDAATTSGWVHYENAHCGGGNWPLPIWWERLLEDPRFVNKLSVRWQQLRAGSWSPERLDDRLDELVNILGDAAARNHDRWGTLGKEVWPNAYVGETYAAEVEFLRRWVCQRAEWMDGAVERLTAR